jgi:hypothetical protein
VAFKNEAEFLTVESITAGLTNSIITTPQFSNGEAAYVNSDAVGNEVTYVVPSIPAGSYTKKLAHGQEAAMLNEK